MFQPTLSTTDSLASVALDVEILKLLDNRTFS